MHLGRRAVSPWAEIVERPGELERAARKHARARGREGVAHRLGPFERVVDGVVVEQDSQRQPAVRTRRNHVVLATHDLRDRRAGDETRDLEPLAADRIRVRDEVRARPVVRALEVLHAEECALRPPDVAKEHRLQGERRLGVGCALVADDRAASVLVAHLPVARVRAHEEQVRPAPRAPSNASRIPFVQYSPWPAVIATRWRVSTAGSRSTSESVTYETSTPSLSRKRTSESSHDVITCAPGPIHRYGRPKLTRFAREPPELKS